MNRQSARARLRAAVRLPPPAEDLQAVQELQEARYLPEASLVLHTAGVLQKMFCKMWSLFMFLGTAFYSRGFVLK